MGQESPGGVLSCEIDRIRTFVNIGRMKLRITKCPTCGSDAIKLVRRNFKDTFDGKSFTVPNLRFYECSDCGEKAYDAEAMRAIEAVMYHEPTSSRHRS